MADRMTYFASYLNATDKLKDIAKQGLFTLGVIRYGLRGELPRFEDEACQMAFELIQPIIDSKANHAEAVRRSRKNHSDSTVNHSDSTVNHASMEHGTWNMEQDNITQTEFALEGGEVLEKASCYPFEQFWADYGCKRGSKQEAEKIYSKLSEADRTAIKDAIPRYNSFLAATGISKKYPCGFLRGRRWEDDFTLTNANGQTMPAPTERQDDFENWLAEQPKGAANA